MAFQDLLPWVEADAQRDQQRSEQWRDARRTQTIGTYMATANQIRRQLGYVDNLHKALALVTDPNTHKPVAGHEEEATRLQRQLGEYNVDALHGNLNQVESYIQKLYDPNFNAETGMPGRSPIRALGEKLHLAKPQVSPLLQPRAAGVDSQQFETKLTPEEEQQFQQWKQQYAPNDSGYDYDLRGAFKAGLKPDPQTGHFPDTFKKPNHPTFSNQSMYASQRPDLAGSWQGDQYVKPQPKPQTAGELIRGLRAIQQKYDIAAPGIDTGEKALESEAAAREKEQEFARDLEFKTGLADKYGVDKEAIATAALTGAKAAPKVKTEPLPGTLDGQDPNWYLQTDNVGGIKVVDARGEEVAPDQLARFKRTPKGAAGAGKKTQYDEQLDVYLRSKGKTRETMTLADQEEFEASRVPFGDQKMLIAQKRLRLDQLRVNLMQSQQNFQDTMELQKQMLPMERIQTGSTLADGWVTNHSPQGDSALIFAFLDAVKTSGFRFNQAEQNFIVNARPLMEGLNQRYIQGIETGETLTVPQRQNMANIIKAAAGQAAERQNRIFGAVAPFKPEAAAAAGKISQTAPTGGESPVGTIKPGRGGINYRKSKAGPDSDKNNWEQVKQ